MAMEIILKSKTYGIKALDSAVKKIGTLDKRAKSDALALCAIMADLSEFFDSHEVEGFNSFYEFTADAFDLKKASAYNYADIGKKFVVKTKKGYHSNLLPEEFMDFSVSALGLFIRYSYDDIKKAVDDGELSPTMTIKELKENLKRLFAKSGDGDGDGDGDGAGDGDGDEAGDETVTITCTRNGETIQLTIPTKEFDKIAKKYAKA